MARNIEIKASIDNVDFCSYKAKSLYGCEPEIIEQEDIFFNCSRGRLKLRIFFHNLAELIYYNRKNESGPKTSEYFITRTNEPQKLLHVLAKSYGIKGVVKKKRKLFMIGRTRVHLDQVENLGDFMELEVVLSENEDAGKGITEANHLMDVFDIEPKNLIDCAYIDLLDNNEASRS